VWDDDPLQRFFIERAPPLTWSGIFGYGVVACFGLLFALAIHGHMLNLAGIALGFLGITQVLRGLFRMAWLGLGGTDRPLYSYFARRFRR
jgi:hypothetical protein